MMMWGSLGSTFQGDKMMSRIFELIGIFAVCFVAGHLLLHGGVALLDAWRWRDERWRDR
jgi:hypothetical protein